MNENYKGLKKLTILLIIFPTLPVLFLLPFSIEYSIGSILLWGIPYGGLSWLLFAIVKGDLWIPATFAVISAILFELTIIVSTFRSKSRNSIKKVLWMLILWWGSGIACFFIGVGSLGDITGG